METTVTIAINSSTNFFLNHSRNVGGKFQGSNFKKTLVEDRF